MAEFTLTRAALRPDLVPETPVTMSGGRPYIDSAKWQIDELNHRVSASSVCTEVKLKSDGQPPLSAPSR